jgi:hypothetical protein
VRRGDKMKVKTIEEFSDQNQRNIDYEKLEFFMREKLNELYQKEKTLPLFDYQEIRNSAMIDLIYEIMPSLKEEI